MMKQSKLVYLSLPILIILSALLIAAGGRAVAPADIQSQAYPGAQNTSTNPSYPGPGSPTSQNHQGTQASPTSSSYPGPGASPTRQTGTQPSATSGSYPGPSTTTPQVTRTQPGSPNPSFTSTQTPVSGTITVTPTEIPPPAPIAPPPAGNSVTIWHSWGDSETAMLREIITSFKRLYPATNFTMVYVPKDELLQRYHDASYLGGGSSLLFGPSNWGPSLANENLVTNLKSYASPDSLKDISPAALESGYYHDMLISLPLSQNGVVIFRNSLLIGTAPKTFDELIAIAQSSTHGGIVGSYLEQGSNISTANIIGLGGQLAEADGTPSFDSEYGSEWLDLLASYNISGAVTFNTNYDLDMFKHERVGMIIGSTLDIPALTQSIGASNLEIDPWPTFGTGHLSGWVSVDSVFVNSNTSGDNLVAALNFIGYLIDPNVQTRLAEVDHIPAVTTSQPRDPLIQQALVAFSAGVPYPGEIDPDTLNIYWKELDQAVINVLVNGVDSTSALKQASDNITQFMREMQTTP